MEQKIQEALAEIKRKVQANMPPAAAKGKRKKKAPAPAAVSPGICRADCEICGGSGYWRNEALEIGDPDFGKVLLCPNVDVLSLPYAKRYGIDREMILNLNWSNVLPLEGSRAVEAANMVRSVLERGYGWVFLWGSHGQAKSLILQIATAVSLRAGIQAAYSNMAEILDFLRDSYEAEAGSDKADRASVLLDWYKTLPVLAVDEFDRINKTPWAEERQFLLFDRRYMSGIRHEGVTLLASNRSPWELPSWYRDRVLDGRFEVIELQGPSARPGMTHTDMF